MKRTVLNFLALLILTSLVIVTINIDNSTQAAPIPELTITNVPHDQIHINGNADFATQAANEGWAGDGSVGSPYVIEGYDIQTNTSDGIHIELTDVHFIVRNVNITYGTQIEEFNAINLLNVKNAKIENCSFKWTISGIYMVGSSNNLIKENYFTNNTYGIQLHFSTGNTITDNHIHQNSYEGIWLNYSENNSVLNNEIHNNRGIKLFMSSNCLINYNTFYEFSEIYALKNDYLSIHNNTFLNTSISIEISHNSSIMNNTFSDSESLAVIYTNWSVFSGNNIKDTYGLQFYDSSNNTISRNFMSQTNPLPADYIVFGLELHAYSSDNLVYANTFTNNPKGISITFLSINNTIHHNNFINNFVNAHYVNMNENFWDDNHGQGNYWSNYTGVDLDGDGVGDTEIPHEELDNYPLVEPVDIYAWAEPAENVPSITRNLEQKSGNTYVNLTWETPLDDGGSTITGYKIYRSASPNLKDELITIGNKLYYNDTTVSNGFEYYYKVSAVNALGNGPVSEEIYVRLPPSVPQNVTAVAGDDYILLSWDPPLHNAGEPVIYYTIIRSNSTAIELTIVVNNTFSFNDTGLLSGTTYYYQISAFRGFVGYGPLSDEVNVTTLGSSTPINLDSDYDDLLDSWEMEYFGNLSYGRNDDPDNDHATNFQEMQEGTSPTDSSDVPSYIQLPSEDDPGIGQYWWIIIIFIIVAVIVAYYMKKKNPPEVSKEPETITEPEQDA